MGASQTTPETIEDTTKQTINENKDNFNVEIIIENIKKESELNDATLSTTLSTTLPTPLPTTLTEKELEESYNKGYSDAIITMDEKFNIVANEVYNSIQIQLNSFQEKQIEQSNKEVKYFLLPSFFLLSYLLPYLFPSF